MKTKTKKNKIVIIVGDIEKPDGFTLVKEFRHGIFRNRGFGKSKLFVDADFLKLTALDIKWICNNARVDVLILIKNRDKIKSLPRNIKILEKNEWGMSFDIFECLNKILKDRDRQGVLDYLLKVKPPCLLLFNWLISNVDQIKNIPLFMYLDEHILLKKSPEWFYTFLAFGIKPLSGYIRYKYRIGKKV